MFAQTVCVCIFMWDGASRVSSFVVVRPSKRKVYFVLQHLLRRQQLLAAGNAMTVPVVGAVLTSVLNALVRSGALATSAVPRSIGETNERLRRRGEIHHLRHEIALLDGSAMYFTSQIEDLACPRME